jgi:hypothetical protein
MSQWKICGNGERYVSHMGNANCLLLLPTSNNENMISISEEGNI